MASKTTLTAGNLEALGAARLAALLMEVSESDTVIRRRLRMELAGAESPSELVRQIRKRLATIAGARSFVDWENCKAVVDDLEAQRRLIVEQVAPRTPAVGLDLMWRFLELANPVLQRSMDASGAIAGLFRRAVEDIGAIALADRPDPGQLADAVYRALLENGYGQFDSLIEATQAALGPAALAHVKQRMAALSAEAAPKDRQLAAWAMDQPIDGGARAGQVRGRAARRALQTIADARGDVDTFVARHDAASRKAPRIAAAIAHRLAGGGPGRGSLAGHRGDTGRRSSNGRRSNPITNGTMRGSPCWRRWDAARRRRPRAGRASSVICPSGICGTTCNGCRTSMISRPSSVRFPMWNGMAA
ncbi:hypothetical protein CCS01_30465 [Rhodopila globiformis]|uniref:Uncharacterized protein n=1 Tax=Rhodopila globiformis TaxID=1071 RepID=A0A2S6MV90_RHOGL|nr:DUF6880 family protein [Rhodopila globiformis]PPQ26283.1 hypothetical protein CCS01_30465 [Rhodopila globiformis]